MRVRPTAEQTKMGRVRDLLSSLGKLAILATVQARRGSASVRVRRPHWSRQGTAARKHSRYRLDLGRRARDGHVLGKAISKGRKETRSTPNKQCISWPSSISRSNPLPRDFCDLTPISLQGILLERVCWRLRLQPASPGVAAFSDCVQERRAFPRHSGAETLNRRRSRLAFLAPNRRVVST